MTRYPQLVIISPEIILILQNMLIYALFIDCRESHLRTFCRQILQCARIGRGEGVKACKFFHYDLTMLILLRKFGQDQDAVHLKSYVRENCRF